MDRVTNLASSNLLMAYLAETRHRVDDLQGRLASGFVSQDYAGIAESSNRLVGLESARTAMQRFVLNNERVDRQLAVVEDTLASFQDLSKDVRTALIDFSKTERSDAVDVRLMQEMAFKSLQSLEALLNTEYDGRYLYSGTKVRTPPADFGLTTLQDFQTAFEGNTVTYPTTRDAHLASVALGHADTGDLTFDRATSTITAAAAGTLARIPVGAVVSIGGTTSNDARYTVVANTGTVLTVAAEKLSTSEAAPAATLTAGDEQILDVTATGGLTIDADAGTIAAATAGSLASLEVGALFTLDGAPSAANDGTYRVVSNDGTTVTIAQHRLTDEAPAPSASTLTVASWYQGDTVDSVHRVDSQRTFDLDVNALHPAFEKVIRALSILAQGAHGTEGGLDQHPERVDQAIYLINSALDQAVGGTPPFGKEALGNLTDLQVEVGLERVLLADAKDRLQHRIASIDEETANIEAADPTETSVRLFDQVNALEVSLATISRIQQLSLHNFLS